MNIDRIKYTKEFSYHGFSEWIGMEGTLEEGDNPQEQLLVLRNKLIETFNSVLSDKNVPVIEQPKKSALTQTELLKQQMSTCTELKTLETYKLLVKSNKELQDFYNQQQKIIENGL